MVSGYPATWLLTKRVSAVTVKNQNAESAMRSLVSAAKPWPRLALGTEYGFDAGFCAALYAEILARCCNAPSTPFFITAAIPLIPGSTLYYCMNAVVSNDLSAAEHFGEQTFLAALGIAGGMAIAWCLADLSRKLHALAIRSSGK